VKKIICLIIALLFLPSCATAEKEKPKQLETDEWTQEMFTELVTFVYNTGDQLRIDDVGTTLYNISLGTPDNNGEDDVILVVHLGFLPEDQLVILTVEAFTFIEGGVKVVDHNFYYNYFDEDLGEYFYLPVYIDGNIVTLDKDGILLSTTPKLSQEVNFEGYKNEEWLFWAKAFYNYMQEEKAKGQETQ
jgi:hypothetical protein